MLSKEPPKFKDGSEILQIHGSSWLLEGAGEDRYHYVDRGWIRDYPEYLRAACA